jgi:hypothetical protein
MPPRISSCPETALISGVQRTSSRHDRPFHSPPRLAIDVIVQTACHQRELKLPLGVEAEVHVGLTDPMVGHGLTPSPVADRAQKVVPPANRCSVRPQAAGSPCVCNPSHSALVRGSSGIVIRGVLSSAPPYARIRSPADQNTPHRGMSGRTSLSVEPRCAGPDMTTYGSRSANDHESARIPMDRQRPPFVAVKEPDDALLVWWRLPAW